MDNEFTEKRLALMEWRLQRIENALNLSAVKPGVRHDAQPASLHNPSPADEASKEAKPGNWLGIIAVLCFVLAAGFIIKLSIDSGWLTPVRQIGLAALLGFGLMGAGFALLRSDRAYASLLPGAGVIILYLSVFAAHRYYALIPFEAAIALTSAVSVVCIWVYTQLRHDVYAITAAAGSYIAPVILGMHADALFSLYYFLLCSVAFATMSVWVQSRTLTLVSSYMAILMSGLVGMGLGQDALLASLLAVHFVVFATGTYFYTLQNGDALSEQESWSFLPVLLIFYALEYHLISRIEPVLAPWISLGFAGVLVALYLSAKRYFPDGLGSQALIMAFATIVCFHSVYLELLPELFRPWLFVVFILAFAFMPSKPAYDNRAFRLPILAVQAILLIEFLSIFTHLLGGDKGQWLALSFVAFASIWLVLTLKGNDVAARPSYGVTLLGAAHMLAIVGFYRLTEDVGSLAVSASWLFYAVAVMAFAFNRSDNTMAKSAMFILAFAAGKALLYDAASAPTIVRIFCLLLTGGVLYGCGLFMRRLTSR